MKIYILILLTLFLIPSEVSAVTSTSEKIASQTETTYQDYDKLKTLVDLGYFLGDYIVSGGAAVKDATYNNTVNVTAIVVSLDNDVTRREATSFKTTVANSVYYLDYKSSGDFHFGTAHYVGSYLPIAQVTTDANKNVLVITDQRDLYNGFRFKPGTTLDAASIGNGSVSNTEYGYLDGVTSPIQSQFAGASAEISQVANEAYRLELSDIKTIDATFLMEADESTVVASVTTAKDYAPGLFPVRSKNFIFDFTLIEPTKGLFVILGGTIEYYTAVLLGAGGDTGRVFDFQADGTITLRALPVGAADPNFGDTVQVIATGTTYQFNIKRVGSASFSNWFTLIKANIPAVGWANNSNLGVVKEKTSTFALFKNATLSSDTTYAGGSGSGASASSVRWKDATLNALGDSITAADVYQQYLKDSMGLGLVNSYGSSGTCITATGSGDTGAMSIRYSTMTDTTDIVTVLGGTNDYGLSRPLGTMGDTTNITYYGALKVLIEGLLAKYPTKTIVFFTPLQRNFTSPGEQAGVGPNAAGHTLLQYVDAMKEMCEIYSIPVYDLYRNAGITAQNIPNFTVDGLHPNTEGHRRFANKMASFLNAQ